MVVISAFIGAVIAFCEIISFHSHRNIKEIFGLYFILFIVLNLFFSIIAYYLIPFVTANSIFIEDNFYRASLAGFGYALILKSKLLSINMGNKEISLGPAFIYETLRSYLFKKIRDSLEAKDNLLSATNVEECTMIADQFLKLETYLLAVNTVWKTKTKKMASQKDKEIAQRLKSLRDDIILISKEDSDDRAKRVVMASYLIEHFGGKEQVESLLKNFVCDDNR